MTALDIATIDTSAHCGWRISGRAAIDNRPAVPCTLAIQSNGTWSAELSTFTLADTVDLFFASGEGGHFCGPASVARSRVDSYPLAAWTELAGAGPLLIATPADQVLELPGTETLDGEVVA